MLPKRSAEVFFTEKILGDLDINVFAELELIIKEFFSSTKTESPTEKKRSQNPGFRRGGKRLISDHCFSGALEQSPDL